MRDILDPDVNGFVREKYVRHVLIEKLRDTALINLVPTNALDEKVHSGKAEEYADYFIRMLKQTTGLKADYDKVFISYSSTGRVIETRRVGLFSLSLQSLPNETVEALKNPRKNIDKALELYVKKIRDDNRLPPINGEPQI